MRPTIPENARVRSLHVVDRYPHFQISEGEWGTVRSHDDGFGGTWYEVLMDTHLEGCEEWDNCITYQPEDDEGGVDAGAALLRDFEYASGPIEGTTPGHDGDPITLCPDCVSGIGGAADGPDVPWRPSMPGETCQAADCTA